MKLIVGLGNPGSQYSATRHNVGFRVVDELARRSGTELLQEKFHGWFSKTAVQGVEVALLEPTTFMNRSGQAVLAAGRFYRLELEDLLVISDDIALPVGKLRLRRGGGAGGHNGLQDIIDRLGSDQFARLRLGVGGPQGDQVKFVLSRFDDGDEQTVEQACVQAADAAEAWVSRGIEFAMNQYNA